MIVQSQCQVLPLGDDSCLSGGFELFKALCHLLFSLLFALLELTGTTAERPRCATPHTVLHDEHEHGVAKRPSWNHGPHGRPLPSTWPPQSNPPLETGIIRVAPVLLGLPVLCQGRCRRGLVSLRSITSWDIRNERPVETWSVSDV